MGFMGVGISARNKPTTSENFKMETIVFKILVFIAVVVAVFAKEDEENLAKMFSKEREQMREERKEMRAVFRRENTRNKVKKSSGRRRKSSVCTRSCVEPTWRASARIANATKRKVVSWKGKFKTPFGKIVNRRSSTSTSSP